MIVFGGICSALFNRLQGDVDFRQFAMTFCDIALRVIQRLPHRAELLVERCRESRKNDEQCT